MSNFFRSLFGAKKAAKIVQVAKSRMQTRRLELIGLEERITPATFSTDAAGLITVQLAAGESLTAISSTVATSTTAVVTFNYTSSVANSAFTPSSGSGLVQTTNGAAGAASVVTYTAANNTAGAGLFSGISILGSTGSETVANSGAVDLLSTNPAAASSFNVGSSVETLTVAGAITAKGAVAGTSGVTLAATAVGIGSTINTTAGNISITGATTLSAATGLTTTGGAVTITGAVSGTQNLTINSGAGAVSITGIVGATALSALSVTSTGAIGFGAAVSAASVATVSSTGGAVTLGGTVTTSGLVNFAGAVTGTTSVTVAAGTTATFGSTVSSVGAISVTSSGNGAMSFGGTVTGLSLATVGTGGVALSGAVSTTNDISLAGAVTSTSPISVTSTAGNVAFGSTVASSTGAVTVTAATAGKTISLTGGVTAVLNSNILLTGDVVSNSSAAALNASGTGTITITGKVDGVVAANDLTIVAENGAIIITGAVGGSTATPTLDILSIDGFTTFLASGAVNVVTLNVGQASGSVHFGTSVTFAGAVTVGTVLNLDTTGNGTVSFAKTITATGTADIDLGSVNGSITVTGVITGKDDVNIVSSGSGLITLSGAISTDQVDGDIYIESATGNIVTSGAISTTGATASIIIDTATSGNVTIGGNVSTTGGGDIILAADNATTATGAGNLTINGTVITTGVGDIIIGVSSGSVAVNNTVTSGATGDVIFITTAATDAITIASGKNITAGFDVADFGAGILNLGANITAGGTAGIILDEATVNLTGAVSLKTTGAGSDITLTTVNGAQNLTLETPAVSGSDILLGTVGATTSLNTITVTNSGGVTVSGNFNGSVVLTDTTGAVAFNGTNTTIGKLTTALKGYSVAFGNSSTDTTVLSGAPVFLNTGGVSFQGTTSLTTGATITGNVTSTVTLANTIVSGGAFNIGAAGNTGVVTIANGTQLILNSTVASIIANPIAITGASSVLNLLGTGTMTLSADSASGTSDDTISVINGTLNVTGKIGGASTATSGTISGAGGTIGTLTVNTGTVAPGGTLKTAAVTLNAATNYSAAVLTATTASNLESSALINLGGSVLSLSSVAAGLAVGNTFTIINNTHASNAITGTFANQAEGSSISAKDTAGNTVAFTVSYKGGTNANDVTLKVTSITSTTPAPTAPAQPMVAGQPALLKFTAVGADAGGGPLVTITFQNGTYVSFFAYASTFTGGVRVALGDVDGNSSVDVITGAGPGGGPQVNVYNVNTATGAVSLQKSFFAFNAPSFTGGIYVAAGDTNADGFDDVIIGAGATGGSRVQVYAGSATGVVTTSTLNDFFAYSPAFTGGVVVAAGQRDAVAGEEIITAPASGGGYNIKSFNANGTGNSPTVVDNFFAFNNTTSVGGLSLAVGILNSGSIADLIVGTSNGGYGVIIDSTTSGITGTPFAGFTGAIRAGVAEDSTGQDFAVALAGPTGAPRISVFSVGATQLAQTDSLFVMNTAFTGGLFGTPSL